MRRICFTLQVRPDKIEEYTARHREVWPEMQDRLRETGWGNYSLFLRPDGLLIGYLETPDWDAARAGMAAAEVNARWQASVGDLFADLGDQDPDEAMAPIPEVFHLD